MTEDQKASLYGHLLNEHRKLHNSISEIKASSIDLNQKQLMEIRRLEYEQSLIMSKINKLLSR